MAPQLPWKSALMLTAAFAAAGELALRAAGFRYPSAAERALKAPSATYRLDAERLWVLQSGAALPWAPGEKVNARGMRGPEVADARDPARLRIAVLGSDSALGVGVAWSETWPARLAAALEQRGVPTELLVAASESATVRMSLERWRRDLRALQPDVVFICHAGTDELTAAQLGISDEARLADPASFAPQPHALEGLRSAVRICQFGDWLLDIRSGEYWHWRQRALEEQRLRAAQQTFDVKGTRRVLWTDFLAQTRLLKDEVRESGSNPFLFPIPGEALMSGRSPVAGGYLSVVDKLVAEQKVPAFSPLAILQASGKSPAELFRGSALSAEGHRILAEFLVEKIGPRALELRR